MKEYLVYVMLGTNKAYAAGISIDGEYVYSFAIEEATRYDNWKMIAINAVNARHMNWVYFIHDANEYAIAPKANWQFEEIE